MKASAGGLRHFVDAAYKAALDAVFPPRCAGCGIWSKAVFCPACRAALHPIAAPLCHVCGTPFDSLAHSASECAECRTNRYHGAPPFRTMRAVYTFEGPLRQAVHRFKYRGKTALAAPLAALLHEFLRHQATAIPAIPLQGLALLTPVPLHPWRRYRRGFNQSELLARELGARLNVPAGEVLRRTRHTTPQVELKAKARAQNVQGAFAVDAAALRRLNPDLGPMLLIDDVCTTGATLRECAGVLRRAGVREIYIQTLARQLPHSGGASKN